MSKRAYARCIFLLWSIFILAPCGDAFKLTRSYTDYDTYKNDPNNPGSLGDSSDREIDDPSEDRSGVQRNSSAIARCNAGRAMQRSE